MELTIFYWGAGFGIRTGDSIKYCTAAGLRNSLKEYAKDRSSSNQFKGRLDKYLEGNPLQVTWKIAVGSQKTQCLCVARLPPWDQAAFVPLNPGVLGGPWRLMGRSETTNGVNTWKLTGLWEGQGETGTRWKGGDSDCMEKSAYRAHTEQLGSYTTYLWQSWCLRHGMSGAVPHKLTRDFKTMVWDNYCSQSPMWGQGTKTRWIQ